jgi:hypothetical protein
MLHNLLNALLKRDLHNDVELFMQIFIISSNLMIGVLLYVDSNILLVIGLETCAIMTFNSMRIGVQDPTRRTHTCMYEGRTI